MSPARPSSRRNPSGGFKPYTRGAAQSVNVTPIMVSSNSGSGSCNGSTSSPSPGASFTDPHLHLHSANSPPHTPQLNPHQLNYSPQHLNINTPPHAAPPHIVERPGFPTYAQYKQVETAYLRSLTPRRQGKALISQRMFDRIWDVLHQPDSPGETAQFRFWARKMFTVRTIPGVPRGGATVGAGPPTMGDFPGGHGHAEAQEVLLHDNLLVAIQEQLYDLLCYCHGSTGHGGRDKTCALIRKHYTWVPKDLVSSFIKTCPTCIMKKCGGGGVSMGMNLNANANAGQQQIQERQEEVRQEDQRLQMHHSHHPHQEAGLPLPGMRDFFQNMYGMDLGVPAPSHSHGIPWPTIGGGGSPSEHPLSPMGMSMSMSLSMSGSGSGPVGISRSGSGSGAANASGSTPGSESSSDSGSGSGSMHEDDPLALDYDHDGAYRARSEKPHLHGRCAYPAPHPMVREVALYKGLPNGWQYRHADYASAHAEFMAAKAAGALSGVDADHGGMQMHLDTVQRARVPSILPLWGPEKFTQSEYEAISAGNVEQLQGLSPVLPASAGTHANANGNGNDNGDGRNSGLSPTTHSTVQFASGTQQMSLQYLLMNTPKDAVVNARPYTPQIDPILLGYSAADASATSAGTTATAMTGPTLASSSGSTSAADSGTPADPEAAPEGSQALAPSSSSPSTTTKRGTAPAPLRIHLDFPPPEKSFQALLTYRDSLGDGILTPDSPLLEWGLGRAGAGRSPGSAGPDGTTPSGPPSLAYPASSPSPSLSGGSGLSQLSSAFRVSLADDLAATSSADSTPASSALPTPVDEHGHGVDALAVDIKGKRKMDSDEEAEAQTRLEMELSEGIQIVLGLHAQQREMASEV